MLAIEPGLRVFRLTDAAECVAGQAPALGAHVEAYVDNYPRRQCGGCGCALRKAFGTQRREMLSTADCANRLPTAPIGDDKCPQRRLKVSAKDGREYWFGGGGRQTRSRPPVAVVPPCWAPALQDGGEVGRLPRLPILTVPLTVAPSSSTMRPVSISPFTSQDAWSSSREAIVRLP